MSQWRYCIRLENLGSVPVQLRERYWKIFSLSGTLETVRGRGVVGQVCIHIINNLKLMSTNELIRVLLCDLYSNNK